MSTPAQDQATVALEAARQLAREGIPIFVAPPSADPKDTSGFRLPYKWQQTAPDPAVLDRWEPGWAVCMVCGCGLDLVDLDLYNGADPDALNGQMPVTYGTAATVSGGVHCFIRSMDVPSKNGLFQGIDIKAGTADGEGRGFAFIAPTVKASKVTGQPATYSWVTLPSAAAARAAVTDTSGQGLAELIRGWRPGGNSPLNGNTPLNGKTPGSPSASSFMRPNAWGRRRPPEPPHPDDIRTTLAGGRNNGVMRLTAALRGQGGWTLDAAIRHMYEHVWPLIPQDGHDFPQAEFEATIRAQWRQYPDGYAQQQQRAEENVQSPVWPIPGGALELTDAYLVDPIARWCLGGRFIWASGLDWLTWTGQVWAQVNESVVHEAVRTWLRAWQAYAANPPAAPDGSPQLGADPAILGRMTTLLSTARITAITKLTRGYPTVIRDAAEFDAYPDAINTPGQIVDLRTGETYPNNPQWLFTKITSGRYIPRYTHDDWDQALTALDPPERTWFQRRMGQAITGHPPSDGIMPVLCGPGENGKTALTTDGPVRALGGFAEMASHKLITSQSPGRSEHSTEMADLRGQRLLIGEELSEGRSIDVTALKRIMDVGRIRARKVYKDNVTFTASHSLMVTTNYRPVINETDHGTWRRLALVRFRYTFRKTMEDIKRPDTDRLGDPGLKQRIRQNPSGQHDAIVTWAIDGARRWYDDGFQDAPLTEQIVADTLAWRAEADRILGFCLQNLIPDHNACILASDMLDQFNAWIGQGGHKEWTRETFISRFAGHEWATRNGIENRRTRALEGLVPWPVPGAFQGVNRAAKQATVWLGVRPRTAAELDELGSRAECAEGPVTFLGSPRVENVVRPSAHSAHPLSEAPSVSLPVPGFTPPADYAEESKATDSPASESPKAVVTESDKSPGTGFVAGIDLETASAGELFTYTPHDQTGYVRLAGIIGAASEPQIVAVHELLPLLDQAGEIYGHNILGFDGLALAWHHRRDDPGWWDRFAARARDTELIARQADPPRSRETHSADKYDLDQVAAKLGVPGKTDDLNRLRTQHGGYDRIPLDDPEYRSYLEGDLRATRAVAELYHNDEYTIREHKLAAIAGRMSLNGFRVDQLLLEQRLEEGAARKQKALSELGEVYHLPLGRTVTRGRGKAKHEETEELVSPLAGKEGKRWLERVWQAFGITDPPRTGKTGALATGADELAPIAAAPGCPEPLRRIIELMRIVTTTRTVYQTARDHLCADGRVHAKISMRQASGRWSTTEPGLTVFGKHAGRHVERDIFIPDDGHVLFSADLAQVDMRAMAGHSQDPAYMAMFEPGRDAHTEIGKQVGLSRQNAKAVGHGWNYGLGARKMIENGMDPDMVNAFIAGMQERFPRLIAWREEIRAWGAAGNILDNGFGRRMRCDPHRAYTVAPALMGQGGAGDIMKQVLLHLPRELDPYLRVMVHDEQVFSVPAEEADRIIATVREAFTWRWANVPILCDINGPGSSWGSISAK